MKKRLLLSMLICWMCLSNSYALSFVNYVDFTNPSPGTIVIWINADTNFGEGVMAQIRYGNPFTFSGFVPGEFDNTTFPGANWKVTLTYPDDVASVDIETAGCFNFSDCVNTGGFFSGFANTALVAPLPVELTAFTAETLNKAVQLTWTTAREINNSHFEIEKSTDLRTWIMTETIDGNGSTNASNTYGYMDKNPANGVNYYRLKQVDFNGQFEFSETVAVQFEKQNSLGVYPNPARDQLWINTNDENQMAQISIYNLNGQLQKEWQQGLGLALDLRSLPNGLYQLIIRDEQGLLLNQERFVKH